MSVNKVNYNAILFNKAARIIIFELYSMKTSCQSTALHF